MTQVCKIRTRSKDLVKKGTCGHCSLQLFIHQCTGNIGTAWWWLETRIEEFLDKIASIYYLENFFHALVRKETIEKSNILSISNSTEFTPDVETLNLQIRLHIPVSNPEDLKRQYFHKLFQCTTETAWAVAFDLVISRIHFQGVEIQWVWIHLLHRTSVQKQVAWWLMFLTRRLGYNWERPLANNYWRNEISFKVFDGSTSSRQFNECRALT